MLTSFLIIFLVRKNTFKISKSILIFIAGTLKLILTVFPIPCATTGITLRGGRERIMMKK